MTIVCEVAATTTANITALAECNLVKQVIALMPVVITDDFVGNIVENIEDRLPVSNL